MSKGTSKSTSKGRSAARTQTDRHSSELGSWEMVHRSGGPFASYVRRYCAWTEHTHAPMRRREVPSSQITLIFNLGPPLDVESPELGVPPARLGSFAAALHDAYSLTEHAGDSHGIEVNLTPPAARMVLGAPMDELTNRVVPLDDLWGRQARLLTERLENAGTAEARFEILDHFIMRRVSAARTPPPGIAWAWERLQASHGGVEIGTLADALEYSPRRLITGFRDQVGMAPKLIARVLRFERAIDLLKQGEATSWGELALDCGYYDQAHFNRDFRRFSGRTPGELHASRLPDGGGFATN